MKVLKNVKKKNARLSYTQSLSNEKKAKLLFSTKRIESFGGAYKYLSHLQFTQEIFPLIQNIEIILRNKIDAVMRGHSPIWLLKLYDKTLFQSAPKNPKELEKNCKIIQKSLKSICRKHNITDPTTQELEKIPYINDTILSQMNFGFWINLLISNNFSSFGLVRKAFPNFSEKIINDEINFLDFLDQKSRNDIASMRYSKIDKCLIFFSFSLAIRNRAFHWENLFKVNQNSNGEKYSSITIRIPINGEDAYLSFSTDKKMIRRYLEIVLRELDCLPLGRCPSVRTRNGRILTQKRLNNLSKSIKERK